MKNKQTARFTSVCSAIDISRFPLPLHPPKLDVMLALIGQKETVLGS